jgi:hypothetical protein
VITVTRRPIRARRLLLVIALTADTAILASACGTRTAADGGADQVAAPTTAVTEPGAASTPTSPRVPASTSVVPGGWRLCSNPHVGYSIAYPGDWYTTALRTTEVCAQFHPTRFTIPEFGEYPPTALTVRPTPGLPTEPTDSIHARTLLWEMTSVGGNDAVRFEELFTGEGLYPKGAKEYGYVIELKERVFRVYATWCPGEDVDYADWKVVVDRAVRTLDVE